MVKKLLLGLSFGFFLLFFFTNPVQADIAPPDQPQGSNPVPDRETTRVQMEKEVVTIYVQPTLMSSDVGMGGVKDWAKVTAIFNMVNSGAADESMQVRFPLGNLSGWGDGFGNYPEISGFKAAVDGNPVKTKRITTENKESPESPIPWAAFDVTFPAGKTITIEVNYLVRAVGYPPIAEFSYILETGAGWNGPIGSADIILQLPYPVEPENIIQDPEYGYSGAGKFEGNQIIWSYQKLDPSRQNNLHIGIIEPVLWQNVLALRAAVEKSPRNGETWGQLGKAIKQVILEHKGFVRQDQAAKKLFDESRAAYDKAVTLLPNDSLWHTGYADLLWRSLFGIQGAYSTDALKMLQELDKSLRLNPTNAVTLNLAEEISYSYPNLIAKNGKKVTMLGLTATIPAPTVPINPILTTTESKNTTVEVETMTPEPVKFATETLASTREGSPTRTPTTRKLPASAQFPFCPGSAALPLILMGILAMIRIRQV